MKIGCMEFFRRNMFLKSFDIYSIELDENVFSKIGVRVHTVRYKQDKSKIFSVLQIISSIFLKCELVPD